MNNLGRRLAKLEQEAKPQGGVIVIKQCHSGETSDELHARWEREHPGESLDAAELVVIIRSFHGLADSTAATGGSRVQAAAMEALRR